jgi:hypothetical protein
LDSFSRLPYFRMLAAWILFLAALVAVFIFTH